MLNEFFVDGCPEEVERRGLPCKCPFDPLKVDVKDFEVVVNDEDIPDSLKGIISVSNRHRSPISSADRCMYTFLTRAPFTNIE